jgi:hypothetical protein
MHPNGTNMPPGSRFGRFTVLAEDPVRRNNSICWVCRCDCGTIKSVDGKKLRLGKLMSCGCYARETSRTRGLASARPGGRADHPVEYRIWVQMRARCRNPRSTTYAHYGGRGISVSPIWDDFAQFYADMGPRPTPRHSVDRIDNDGPYSPENCRWATQSQQMRNTRVTIRISHNGRTLSITDWAEEVGINRGTLVQRLLRGWSIERALAETASVQHSIAVRSRWAPAE